MLFISLGEITNILKGIVVACITMSETIYIIQIRLVIRHSYFNTKKTSSERNCSMKIPRSSYLRTTSSVY